MDLYMVYLAHEIRILVNSIYNNLNVLRMEGYLDSAYLENAFISAERLIKIMDNMPETMQAGNINENFLSGFKTGYKRVVARTFGEFDIFIDGELIEFTNHKAKELLAICIDSCGGEVTMKKATSMLWENRNYDEKVKRLYRKAVAYLNTLFAGHGVEKIFTNGRGHCHVNRNEFECDYCDVMEGKNIKETSFNGKYMSNYSWAEETCGILCHMAAVQLRE